MAKKRKTGSENLPSTGYEPQLHAQRRAETARILTPTDDYPFREREGMHRFLPKIRMGKISAEIWSKRKREKIPVDTSVDAITVLEPTPEPPAEPTPEPAATSKRARRRKREPVKHTTVERESKRERSKRQKNSE